MWELIKFVIGVALFIAVISLFTDPEGSIKYAGHLVLVYKTSFAVN